MSTPFAATDTPKQHILIVDDDSTFRHFLVRAIGALGHFTNDVSSPEEMEAALRVPPLPDLVLLDWNLGHTTAQDMYVTLRERGIPVVVMTGDPVAIENLVEPILAKPFSLETLRSLLESERGKA